MGERGLSVGLCRVTRPHISADSGLWEGLRRTGSQVLVSGLPDVPMSRQIGPHILRWSLHHASVMAVSLCSFGGRSGFEAYP